MRKPNPSPSFGLLLGVLLLAAPMAAWSDEVTDDQDTPAMWRLHGLRVGAATLRTSARPPDPDTVWIGHIHDPGFKPQHSPSGNPAGCPGSPDCADVPGVPAGGYGPAHTGRGYNLP